MRLIYVNIQHNYDTDDAITRRNSYSDAVKCTPMREEREQAVS